MGISGGALLTGLSNARGAFSENKAASQAKAQQDALSRALLMRKLEQEAARDKLAAALNQSAVAENEAQAGKFRRETDLLGQPKPVASRRSPVDFTVGGKAVQGSVDEEGNYYNAAGEKITDASPYERPTQTSPEPLEVTVGPDGKRVLTPRSKAAGMESPAPVGPQADRVLVPVQQPDGTVVYTPRPEAAGQQAPRGQAGRSTAALRQKVATNQVTIDRINQLLGAGGEKGLVDQHPTAFGLRRMLGEAVNQRVDKAGIDARSLVSNIGSMIIHDRSGAAVPLHEFKRLAPFIPLITDSSDKIKKNLKQLLDGILLENSLLQQGIANGTVKPDDVESLDEGGGAAPPSKPAAGGKTITVNGKTFRVPE